MPSRASCFWRDAEGPALKSFSLPSFRGSDSAEGGDNSHTEVSALLNKWDSLAYRCTRICLVNRTDHTHTHTHTHMCLHIYAQAHTVVCYAPRQLGSPCRLATPPPPRAHTHAHVHTHPLLRCINQPTHSSGPANMSPVLHRGRHTRTHPPTPPHTRGPGGHTHAVRAAADDVTGRAAHTLPHQHIPLHARVHLNTGASAQTPAR